MTKCMWCNGICVEVPNGNDFLLKTYAYCTHCDELVPKNKSLFGVNNE